MLEVELEDTVSVTNRPASKVSSEVGNTGDEEVTCVTTHTNTHKPPFNADWVALS